MDTPGSSSTGQAHAGKQPRRRDGLSQLPGWRVQWRVVDALVYRELRTRVSDINGGFLGVLVQPLGLIAIWTAFLSALNLQRGGNLNVVLFLGSGIVLFTIFSQIANRSTNAMDANEALLFYKPVKPIDTVIARTICETGLYTCCLMVVCAGTWVALDQIVMNDLGLFFFTILLAAAIGFSTGLLFMIGGHLSRSFKGIAVWIPRILWFSSGVPFRYWLFPPWTRVFFVWNPLTHIIELNRQSMSADYYTPDANLEYAMIWVVCLLTAALWVYRNNERRMLSQ